MIGTIKIDYSYPGGHGRIEIDALEFFPVSQEKCKKLRKIWDLETNLGSKETDKLLIIEALALLTRFTEEDIKSQETVIINNGEYTKKKDKEKLKSLNRKLRMLKANAEEVNKWEL